MDITERVRKLLALAEDRGTPLAEAEAASTKAAKLMMEYNIDAALISFKAQVYLMPVDKKFTVDNPFSLPKGILLTGISKAFSCRAIRTRDSYDGGSVYHLFGFENDLNSVNVMYTSLLLQGSNDLILQKYYGNTSKSYSTSFWKGFAYQAGQRLMEANKEVIRSSSEPGTDLVLRDRAKDVDRALKDVYPRVVSFKTSVSNGTAYNAGKSSANSANLHNRSSVSSRKALDSQSAI